MTDALNHMERCILGAILNGVHVSEVQAQVSPEMMLNPDNRLVFEIMRDLDEEGVALSYITVASRIHGLKSGEDPMAYVSACIPAHQKEKGFDLAQFCHTIRRAAAERMTAELAGRIQKQIEKREPIEKIIGQAEVEVSELGRMIERHTDTTLATAARSSIKRMSDAYEGRASTGVPWPLHGLLSAADGNMQEGNFHSVLLDSAGGKTSLALQVIRNAAEQGIPALFISYEQDAEQCMRQMSSQRLKIESKRMARGEFTTAEFDRISADHEALASLPIEIQVASGWSAKQIASRARRFRRTRGRGLVVIDHAKSIHLGRESLFAEQINVMMQTLRDAFKELGLAGLLLQQRRLRDVLQRFDPSPMKSDCYGGDAGHESLDLMLGIWRPEQIYRMKLPWASDRAPRDGQSEKEKFEIEIKKNEGLAKVVCLKNRYGDEHARAELEWEPRFTLFSDSRMARNAQEFLETMQF